VGTHTKRSQSEAVVKELYMQHSGTFAIELKSEGKCIGCIDLRVDKDHDKGSFGYVMTRNYWGHGYMSEALSLLLDVAFTTLNINRVEARHYSKNIASGRVMEKCGMQYEGTALQEVKVKGVYFDVVHYGILKQNYSSPYKKEKC
jgi:ribosomal-protein-alanine N-acetyltransferase